MGLGVAGVAPELLVRGDQGEEAGREEAGDVSRRLGAQREEIRLRVRIHSRRLMLSRCSPEMCMSCFSYAPASRTIGSAVKSVLNKRKP